MAASLTADIKKAARIGHSQLDAEIARLESTARAELIRLGVPSSVAESTTEPLIDNAIITMACMELARGDKSYDSWKESWDYQKDCLRKHKWEEN